MRDKQREQLQKTVAWATKLRRHLQPILDTREHVHFRPSSQGVAMVGLRPNRPQRGRTGIKNLEQLAQDFDAEFTKHCVDIDQGRPTAEKELQSFWIAEAYRNERRLVSLTRASQQTNAPVELLFVTDEIPVPTETGKIVCDILAARRTGEGIVPVLVELKSAREKTRLIAQVEGYSRLVDSHAELFAELYAALLGESVRFAAPCEKWIVWPAAGDGADPHEVDLVSRGIRVATYVGGIDHFSFHVGPAPHLSRVGAAPL